MAGQVVWHITTSLDGFIAGPNDSMDWVFERASEPSSTANDVIVSTGAILAGRRWWDVAQERYGGLDGIYGGAWVGPVFVLTHRSTPPPADPRLAFVSQGVPQAVALALEAAKGKNVVILGANIAQQCLRAQLVDEIVVHIVPVLLGDGIRLIASQSIPKTELEMASVVTSHSGQRIDVRLRVLKS